MDLEYLKSFTVQILSNHKININICNEIYQKAIYYLFKFSKHELFLNDPHNNIFATCLLFVLNSENIKIFDNKAISRFFDVSLLSVNRIYDKIIKNEMDNNICNSSEARQVEYLKYKINDNIDTPSK